MRIRALWIVPLILAGPPDRVMSAHRAADPAHTPVAFPGYRSSIRGINDSGTMMGYFDGVDGMLHAFVYINKKYRELEPPVSNGSTLTLLALNNRNQILLSQPYAGFFIYDIARTTFFRVGQDALIAPGPGSATQEVVMDEVTGLNDKDEIVFRAGMQIGYGTPALSVGGSLSPPTDVHKFTAIPGCGEPLPGEPIAINNNDEIVGWCRRAGVFLYSAGATHFIAIPDAALPIPIAISSSGTVVGNYQPARRLANGVMAPSGGHQLFVYRDSALSTPHLLPAAWSRFDILGRGFNDRNQIVFDGPGGGYVMTLPNGNP
jgi:hypothetical protein